MQERETTAVVTAVPPAAQAELVKSKKRENVVDPFHPSPKNVRRPLRDAVQNKPPKKRLLSETRRDDGGRNDEKRLVDRKTNHKNHRYWGKVKDQKLSW